MPNSFVSHHNGDLGGRPRQTRWLTPSWIVDALGVFDLDPAGAPGHSLADHSYLLERGEDGLALPWQGRVWLNPPYGRQTEPFLRKLADHGNGIALIFARTDTRVFDEQVWQRADGILFIRGRLTFLDADGKPATANAGAASCLVAYGAPNAAALRESGIAGTFVPLSGTAE